MTIFKCLNLLFPAYGISKGLSSSRIKQPHPTYSEVDAIANKQLQK